MNTATMESVHHRADLRAALTELRDKSRVKSQGDERYGLDRSDAYQYFSIVPKWRNRITDYIRELKAAGEYVTYVDLCGRARGVSLGADEHYSFSLQPLSAYDFNRRPSGSNRADGRFQGDIFSARDFNRFLALIKQQGDQPAFITFEPVAGLNEYIPFKSSGKQAKLYSEVAYHILERHLKRLVAILRPGGYILMSSPFQMSNLGDFFARVPQEKYESTLRVKELCRKLRCSVEVHGTCFNGPRWLIRKREPLKPRR